MSSSTHHSLMLSVSILFPSRMPANLYPDFHMKEVPGVNSAASKSLVISSLSAQHKRRGIITVVVIYIP